MSLLATVGKRAGGGDDLAERDIAGAGFAAGAGLGAGAGFTGLAGALATTAAFFSGLGAALASASAPWRSWRHQPQRLGRALGPSGMEAAALSPAWVDAAVVAAPSGAGGSGAQPLMSNVNVQAAAQRWRAARERAPVHWQMDGMQCPLSRTDGGATTAGGISGSNRSPYSPRRRHSSKVAVLWFMV